MSGNNCSGVMICAAIIKNDKEKVAGRKLPNTFPLSLSSLSLLPKNAKCTHLKSMSHVFQLNKLRAKVEEHNWARCQPCQQRLKASDYLSQGKTFKTSVAADSYSIEFLRFSSFFLTSSSLEDI